MKRVALVTGGTRGIGLGIARELAREGFDLVVSGVRAEAEVRAALEQLRADGADVQYLPADLADRAAREGLVASLRAHVGRLHVLVNNAGIAPSVRADLLDASEESFERLLRTNLQGPYFLTQALARFMIDQKAAEPSWRGCIVNVTSVSATLASTNRGEYCVSKAGLAMATRLWALRLAPEGVPVYEVRPGIIHTDMTSGVARTYDALIADGLVPQGRWGEAEDVGRVVAALARGDAPYSTGAVVVVDGGLSLPRL